MAITTLKTQTAVDGQAAPAKLEDNMFARVRQLNTVITAVNTLVDDYNATNVADNRTAATGNSVTIDSQVGVVTTAALTTAALATETITVTNSTVTTSSIITVTPGNYAGTFATHGIPVLGEVIPGSGSFTITLVNVHATNALQGAMVLYFTVSN